jgi:ABC-type lipoprotein release transport system permease subunit
MILKLSWKNIWRNPVRSLVVMGAIMIGVWAVIFLSAFSTGMIRGYVKKAIENELSHIQFHHTKFGEDRETQFFIPDASDLTQEISADSRIQMATNRTLVSGMISTGRGARGIQIKGVDALEESKMTRIDEKLVEGKYLEEAKKNPILVGKKLADNLKLKLRSKIVLTFLDTQQEIVAASFRVAGIFDTKNSNYDESTVFVNQKDLNRLLQNETLAHELAILIKEPLLLDTIISEMKIKYPDWKIESYREISPDVDLYESQINVSSIIFMIIVMMALFFGIINSMLMVVLERVRELGMLMAIGMNKIKVFSMIILETILVSGLAAAIGIILGYLTVKYFSHVGINLSSFSKGMQEFGLEEIIYTELDTSIYFSLALAIIITALLGALYPAFRAIGLKPVEAIRKL